MKLQLATRQQARIRLGIQGPSGSGKTHGALQIGIGLANGDWTKIAVIDTEYGSASLYSHLGPYNVINLTAPFGPDRYSDALQICEQAGMEVIIMDSISHEWDGSGGILDIHNAMTGNSFTNWGRVTPLHSAFVQSILASSCHVITTIRSKQDYVLTDKNGKMVPEKVGLKGVQRDGIEYELTTLFEIDIKHNVTATKDRTSLFSGKPEFKLTPIIGQKLNDWCNLGQQNSQKDLLIQQIEQAATVESLRKLYKDSPGYQSSLHENFSRKRKQLETTRLFPELLHQQNQNRNGQHDTNEG